MSDAVRITMIVATIIFASIWGGTCVMTQRSMDSATVERAKYESEKAREEANARMWEKLPPQKASDTSTTKEK